VSPVSSLSLTPDGWTLLSAARDQTAALWDLRSHTKLATVPTFEAVEGACSGTLLC
jgi:WD40 repeat protein